MNRLSYQYYLEDSVLVIEDLLGGWSVYSLANEVLAQIEAEVGSLENRYILWKGSDELWDLLLPELEAIDEGMAIYPLGGRTLDAAKAQLAHLVVSGLVPKKIL
ncbi:hypothetical protein J2I47_07250 [Fibrella sp. HMF5335]|uniref:Uncharacterized protein n=1 Tax=Fibrella rubiginis TaxID=2817060 RepID=A0A939K4M3_9BACT|nr:hypothetical protein [Fibrella rubiginis]MBO0936341.1 hypothetical protein [Fibrella rubiginis]